jgi:hypothetical protein
MRVCIIRCSDEFRGARSTGGGESRYGVIERKSCCRSLDSGLLAGPGAPPSILPNDRCSSSSWLSHSLVFDEPRDSASDNLDSRESRDSLMRLLDSESWVLYLESERFKRAALFDSSCMDWLVESCIFMDVASDSLAS